jgi:hypothetical protein
MAPTPTPTILRGMLRIESCLALLFSPRAQPPFDIVGVGGPPNFIPNEHPPFPGVGG